MADSAELLPTPSSNRLSDILNQARQRLSVSDSISPSASLDAQVLLAEVLQVNRAHLLAHPERLLTPDEITRYEIMIARREQGEPVAYILGRKPFYDREMIVTPAVLIPRPETELLLEWALEIARNHPVKTVVDVGTGSGALAVTFAALMSDCQVYAVDLSPAALAVARQNATRQQANITFLEGDLLQPLIDRQLKVDLVLANLPYITRDEVTALEVSRYEPVMALDGGSDGLDLVRRLLEQASAACQPQANLLLEIGADQGAAMRNLGREFALCEIRHDYAGLDRMVRLQLR
ncbi:MAG TPA: peptide chain release factor N(5)-glutamine methyltransferase [Phototrophicaceae bacterium]|jgi:release factor glutamine methyltransferase|nr:peptide chain release factor N(5)-glutamine methyltransferase [Phototrophicaceae bacterium]